MKFMKDNLHNELPFLPERMKIENVEKIVAHLRDKTEYAIQIKNLSTNYIEFKYIESLNLIKKFSEKHILI